MWLGRAHAVCAAKATRPSPGRAPACCAVAAARSPPLRRPRLRHSRAPLTQAAPPRARRTAPGSPAAARAKAGAGLRARAAQAVAAPGAAAPGPRQTAAPRTPRLAVPARARPQPLRRSDLARRSRLARLARQARERPAAPRRPRTRAGSRTPARQARPVPRRSGRLSHSMPGGTRVQGALERSTTQTPSPNRALYQHRSRGSTRRTASRRLTRRQLTH